MELNVQHLFLSISEIFLQVWFGWHVMNPVSSPSFVSTRRNSTSLNFSPVLLFTARTPNLMSWWCVLKSHLEAIKFQWTQRKKRKMKINFLLDEHSRVFNVELEFKLRSFFDVDRLIARRIVIMCFFGCVQLFWNFTLKNGIKVKDEI